MIGVDLGLKLLKGRLARATQPNYMSVLVRALSSCSSQKHCILFNKGLLQKFKLFAPIYTKLDYVDGRFHAAVPSRWTPSMSLSCQCGGQPSPSCFTWHFDSVQECRVKKNKTKPAFIVNFEKSTSFICRSRSRPRDTCTILLPVKCYRTYHHRSTHSTSHHRSSQKNPKLDQDQGQRQQFNDDKPIASFLSISTLFAIFCLLKKAYGEENQLFREARCLSQDNERKVFNGQSMEGNLRKAFDVSTNFLSNTACQKQNDICNRSCGRIQGKVEETDELSFKQAVEKVDDLLEKRKVEVGSPGIVVCVSVDGKFVYAKGFGHADVENQVPIHPHSVIRIASISKAITAAIVAKLVDEGKINLDESVYHYVPKFPGKDFLGEKVDITVRQLLNHTSGIRSYWLENDPVIALQPKLGEILSEFDTGIQHLFYSNLKVKSHPKKQADEGRKKKTQKEEGTSLSVLPLEYYQIEAFPSTTKALEMFSKDRLVAKPAVVEAVTKKSFASVAKETFHLWGMKETYLDQKDPLIYNRARHYQKKKGTLVNTPHIDVSYKWAGGGFLSSVMDVVKFGNILLYSSQHGDDDSGLPGYLKQSTVHEFWTSIENKRTGSPINYGLGFELVPAKMTFGMCPTHSSLAGHSGAAVGASSHVLILPRLKTQTKVDDEGRMNKSVSSSRDASHGSAQSSEKDALSVSQKQLALPQGVVVAVIVNLIGVTLRDITVEIARIFERVVLD